MLSGYNDCHELRISMPEISTISHKFTLHVIQFLSTPQIDLQYVISQFLEVAESSACAPGWLRTVEVLLLNWREGSLASARPLGCSRCAWFIKPDLLVSLAITAKTNSYEGSCHSECQKSCHMYDPLALHWRVEWFCAWSSKLMTGIPFIHKLIRSTPFLCRSTCSSLSVACEVKNWQTYLTILSILFVHVLEREKKR